MLRCLNACLVLAALVSAFVLYRLEHATRATERDIARMERKIAGERETIKLLTAEWSSLTRPERLQRLAETHLGLKPVSASQLVSESELPERVPAEPPVTPHAASSDPLADIIRKMD